MVTPEFKNYLDTKEGTCDFTYGLGGESILVVELRDKAKILKRRMAKEETFLKKEIAKVEHYIEIACSVEGFWSGRKLKILFAEKAKLMNRLEILK
jgi:hypothetical protein